MAERKKKAAKESEKASKADIIKAIEDMPKASNLVVDNVKYETVKRDEVIKILEAML